MPADDGATAYLYAVRVLAPLRSKGIGTALMKATEAAVRERGCTRVRLTVQVVNTRAQKMYAQMGYEVVGTVMTGFSFTDSEGRPKKVNEPAFVMERVIGR